MSHVDASALAQYNSLLDPHLSGYFSNNKKRKHLQKAGLIRKNGEIVSETTYRLTMARKEHQKHVRDLLAQAIVHKTLDMERARQVAIKQKLEEIAKIELVRRVRAERGRKGDEDILPLLTPRKGRSRPATASGAGQRSQSSNQGAKRPKSAPNKRSNSVDDGPVIVVDEDGMPVSPREYEESDRSRSASPNDDRSSKKKGGQKGKKQSKYPQGEMDDKHLYALNRQTLYEYTMARQSVERGGGPSPYIYSQMPPDAPTPPPRSPTRAKSARAGGRRQQAGGKAGSKHGHGNVGSLMLHRPEPAMKHQEKVQTMAEVTLHYFGSSLKLDYEKFDPRDDIMVEQQHCGGNTLPVFRDKVLPGHDFTFVSRRHRGYPFGLTLYINGVEDCRLSACCEYKHPAGARLGGKKGHFGIVGVAGAAPCYKCHVSESSGKKKSKKKKKKAKEESEGEEEEEERKDDVDVQGYGDDETQRSAKSRDIEVPVEDDAHTNRQPDDYDDDFEDDDKKASSRSSRSRSRSSSRSSRSSKASSRSSKSRSRSRSSDRSSSTSKKSDKNPQCQVLQEIMDLDDSDATITKDDDYTSDYSRRSSASSVSVDTKQKEKREKSKSKKHDDDSHKTKESKKDLNKSDKDQKKKMKHDKEHDKEKSKKHKQQKKDDDREVEKKKKKKKKEVKSESESESDEEVRKSKKKSKKTKKSVTDSETENEPPKSKKKTKKQNKQSSDSDTEPETSKKKKKSSESEADDKVRRDSKSSTTSEESRSSKKKSKKQKDESGSERESPVKTSSHASESEPNEPESVEKKADDETVAKEADKPEETKEPAQDTAVKEDDKVDDEPAGEASTQQSPEQEVPNAESGEPQATAAEPDQQVAGGSEQAEERSEPAVKAQTASEVAASKPSESRPVDESAMRADESFVEHSEDESERPTTTQPSTRTVSGTSDTSTSSSSSSSGSSTSDSSSSSSSSDDDTPRSPAPQPANDLSTPDDSTETSGTAAGGVGGAPLQPLTTLGVTEGSPLEGSIRPRCEGRAEIDLAGLCLTDAQVDELCAVIRDNGRVEALVLRNCGISNASLAKVARALQMTPSDDLRMLNLNCCHLTAAAMETVVNIVTDKPNLEILLLHGNPLGDGGVSRLVAGLRDLHDLRQAVSAGATTPQQLEAIRAAARDIRREVIKDVLASSSMESVESAGSSGSSGGVTGVIAASEAAQQIPALRLQMLDLGDLGMSESGAEKLAGLIEANTSIRTLNLTANKTVGMSGWLAIADALRKNSVIRNLSLDYNDLGDPGAAIIAEALKENTSIESLDLEGNRIHDEGGRKLLEMVHENSALCDVTLAPGNSLDPRLAQDIKDVLLNRVVAS